MLCLCGFELYSRWMPLTYVAGCTSLDITLIYNRNGIGMQIIYSYYYFIQNVNRETSM